MGASGGSFERKRIRVQGPRSSAIASAVAEIGGHLLVEGDVAPADLLVIDAERPDAVRAQPPGPEVVVVVPRRLRGADADAFKGAGASAVIDADWSVLDVAFTFSDLLFSTYAQRRRYGRAHGGAPVRFRVVSAGAAAAAAHELSGTEADFHEGRLLDLGRTGAFILAAHRPREGAAVEMVLEVAGRPLPIRGRIAFSADPEDGEIAVELALEEVELAPKVFAFCGASDAPPARVRAANLRRGS